MKNIFRTILLLISFTLLVGCGETERDKKIKAFLEANFTSKDMLDVVAERYELTPSINIVSIEQIDLVKNPHLVHGAANLYIIEYEFIIDGKTSRLDENRIELSEKDGKFVSYRYLGGTDFYYGMHYAFAPFSDRAEKIARKKAEAQRVVEMKEAAAEKKVIKGAMQRYLDNNTKLRELRQKAENKYGVPVMKGTFTVVDAVAVPRHERYRGEMYKILYTIKFKHLVGGETFTHEAIFVFNEGWIEHKKSKKRDLPYKGALPYISRGIHFFNALTDDAEALSKK